MSGADEPEIEVHADGRAELFRGVCAPAGPYRLWDSKSSVADVWAAVERANEVGVWRIQQLDPEELAV